MHCCPYTETIGTETTGCERVFEAEPDTQGFVTCPACGTWFMSASCAYTDLPISSCLCGGCGPDSLEAQA